MGRRNHGIQVVDKKDYQGGYDECIYTSIYTKEEKERGLASLEMKELEECRGRCFLAEALSNVDFLSWVGLTNIFFF